MTLKFRNLTVSPQDPVDQWGFEGLLTAVERGDINDWHRIAAILRKDPRGRSRTNCARLLKQPRSSSGTCARAV